MSRDRGSGFGGRETRRRGDAETRRTEPHTQDSGLSTQHPALARVLLKARPTDAQLADRLADPVPPGLELYLDAADIADPTGLDRLARRLVEVKPGPDFAYVVEGPVRTLDGSFFDLSRDSETNRECLRRLARLAGAIAAEGILIHSIAPRKLGVALGPELHAATLEASLPLVEHYVREARDEGLIPLLENIPPVARQRERSYMCTPIGMRAGDLIYFAGRFPELQFAVDLSHAQLFLNGLRGDPSAVPPELTPLIHFLSTLGDDPDLETYLASLEPHLFELHISNARGLLEEGLPYGDGDLDLDALALRLAHSVRYLVTETLEPNADRATRMREAQRRLEAVLQTLAPLPQEESRGMGAPFMPRDSSCGREGEATP